MPFEPVILFFLLGLLAGVVRSDLKIPGVLYESLSIFLLLAIGLLLDEIRDPQLQKKALRAMLDIVNANRCLTGNEASLIAQALKQWEIALYEVSDTSIPSHRLPLPKVAEIHLA